MQERQAVLHGTHIFIPDVVVLKYVLGHAFKQELTKRYAVEMQEEQLTEVLKQSTHNESQRVQLVPSL